MIQLGVLFATLKSVFLSPNLPEVPSRSIKYILYVFPAIMASIHLGFKLPSAATIPLTLIHTAAILYTIWRPRLVYTPEAEELLRSLNSSPQIERYNKKVILMVQLIIVLFGSAYMWRTNSIVENIFKQYGLFVSQRIICTMAGSGIGFGLIAYTLLKAPNRASAWSQGLVGMGVFVYTFGSYRTLPQLLDVFIYYMYVPFLGLLIDIFLHPAEKIEASEVDETMISIPEEHKGPRKMLLTLACSFLFTWCILMAFCGYYEHLRPYYTRIEVFQVGGEVFKVSLQCHKSPLDTILLAGGVSALWAFMAAIISMGLWCVVFVGIPKILAKVRQWRQSKKPGATLKDKVDAKPISAPETEPKQTNIEDKKPRKKKLD